MENKKPTKEEINQRLNEFISRIDSKDFKLYFYCTDTRGNALASVAQIYEHAKVLKELGYNAVILHDNNKYTPVTSWLGEEFADIPHQYRVEYYMDKNPKTGKPEEKARQIEFTVNSSDFIIIPEVYGNIMEQLKSLPCRKIVMCQNYTYISELIQIDTTWSMYGFNDVITTSQELSDFVKDIFPSSRIHQTPIVINDRLFKKTDGYKKPFISFITKEQCDAKLISSNFFRKYPIFRWFIPRELRGLTQEEYAEALKDSAVLVWVDKRSSFGTAPIEAMKCGVPVIGVVPELIPGWMKSEDGLSLAQNGVWVSSVLEIPDMLNTFCQAHLEDSIPSEIFEGMENTAIDFNEGRAKSKIGELYMKIIQDRKEEISSALKTK